MGVRVDTDGVVHFIHGGLDHIAIKRRDNRFDLLLFQGGGVDTEKRKRSSKSRSRSTSTASKSRSSPKERPLSLADMPSEVIRKIIEQIVKAVDVDSIRNLVNFAMTCKMVHAEAGQHIKMCMVDHLTKTDSIDAINRIFTAIAQINDQEIKDGIYTNVINRLLGVVDRLVALKTLSHRMPEEALENEFRLRLVKLMFIRNRLVALGVGSVATRQAAQQRIDAKKAGFQRKVDKRIERSTDRTRKIKEFYRSLIAAFDERNEGKDGMKAALDASISCNAAFIQLGVPHIAHYDPDFYIPHQITIGDVYANLLHHLYLTSDIPVPERLTSQLARLERLKRGEVD